MLQLAVPEPVHYSYYGMSNLAEIQAAVDGLPKTQQRVLPDLIANRLPGVLPETGGQLPRWTKFSPTVMP